MRDAGIDPDTGLPLDPRAVTFENLRYVDIRGPSLVYVFHTLTSVFGVQTSCIMYKFNSRYSETV